MCISKSLDIFLKVLNCSCTSHKSTILTQIVGPVCAADGQAEVTMKEEVLFL